MIWGNLWISYASCTLLNKATLPHQALLTTEARGVLMEWRYPIYWCHNAMLQCSVQGCWVVTDLRNYPSISVEVLSKSTERFGQICQFLSSQSNMAPPITASVTSKRYILKLRNTRALPLPRFIIYNCQSLQSAPCKLEKTCARIGGQTDALQVPGIVRPVLKTSQPIFRVRIKTGNCN